MLKAPTSATEELFDTGHDIATTWIHSRTDQQLLNIVDPHVLGLWVDAAMTDSIQTTS